MIPIQIEIDKSSLKQIGSSFENLGQKMAEAMQAEVKSHFLRLYPGSQHWNHQDNVTLGFSYRNEGEADVNVAGAERAYQDIELKPRQKSYLTIPMSSEAYGKQASDFASSFVLTKKNGKKFIAQQDGQKLTFLFFLAKSAHQKQDPKLMPSDEKLAESVFQKILE